jgi:hypothetical protein
MTRASSIKKSNFNALTEAVATDYFDFVQNGQNFKITLANLITSLGVSGAIAAAGDVSAIPVLNQDGGVNYIRGILGGSGILASLSAGGAVEIDHNFTIDSTGSAIMANATAASPTFRSIVGGTGITVTTVGNTIEISLT